MCRVSYFLTLSLIAAVASDDGKTIYSVYSSCHEAGDEAANWSGRATHRVRSWINSIVPST